MLDFVDQTAKSHTGPLKDFRNVFLNLDALFDKLFQGMRSSSLLRVLMPRRFS